MREYDKIWKETAYFTNYYFRFNNSPRFHEVTGLVSSRSIPIKAFLLDGLEVTIYQGDFYTAHEIKLIAQTKDLNISTRTNLNTDSNNYTSTEYVVTCGRCNKEHVVNSYDSVLEIISSGCCDTMAMTA